MTIDDAIRELEEMRRQVGGHVPVKYSVVTGEAQKRVDRNVRFEIEAAAPGLRGRVLRIFLARS